MQRSPLFEAEAQFGAPTPGDERVSTHRVFSKVGARAAWFQARDALSEPKKQPASAAQTTLRAALAVRFPELLRGLRAAVATIGPFFLAGVLERPELRWVALGGWLGSIADPGGLRRRRALTIGVFAILGGLVVTAMEASRPWPWLTVLALGLVAFGGSLARASGASAASLGTLVLIAAAIASGGTSEVASWRVSLRDGGLFAAGASWAMLISSVVWPVWTHLPVRRVVAAVHTALADYATELAALARAPETEEASAPHQSPWALLTRKHPRLVRAAIDEARTMVVAARTERVGESPLGENLRALLSSGESQFFTLIALSEEIESQRFGERGERARALDVIAFRQRLTAERLLYGTPAASSATATTSSIAPEAPVKTPPSVLARTLLDASRVSAQIARTPDRASTAAEDDGAPSPTPREVIASEVKAGLEAIGDALSLRSPFLRHAVRVTLAVLIASSLGALVSPTHASWVSVTTIAVLQPYPGATLGRALERVIGTVLGSIVAVLLMTLVNDPLVLTLAMVPLSTAATLTRTRSVRLFAFFVTPVFVLFATGLHEDWWSAALRVIDTVIGGLVAVMAALTVFPSWERVRLPEALATSRALLQRYADQVLEGGVDRAAIDAARRALGAALGEAETSLERMLAEPRALQRGESDAVQRLTLMRRLATSLTAFDLMREDADPRRREVRDYVDAVLEGREVLPLALEGFSPPLARIARRAELLAPPPVATLERALSA